MGYRTAGEEEKLSAEGAIEEPTIEYDEEALRVLEEQD